MSVEERIKSLAMRMALHGGSPDYSNCTAELMDEDDEDGIVVIRAPSGSPLVYMPRDVWDAIRKLGAK